jgi:hypothetical protein
MPVKTKTRFGALPVVTRPLAASPLSSPPATASSWAAASSSDFTTRAPRCSWWLRRALVEYARSSSVRPSDSRRSRIHVASEAA